MRFTAVIEQTYQYKKRMKYVPESHSFVEKDCDSLSYIRGVHFPYGWMKETGTPPEPHLDVYVITDREYELGGEVETDVIGVFWRADNDHKFVGVLPGSPVSDFSELSDSEKEELYRLYGKCGIYEGETWYGREKAEELIAEYFRRCL